MNKKKWKIYYRLVRIARREAIKAMKDAMLYGTGVVFVSSNGEPKHVALPDIKSLNKMKQVLLDSAVREA